MFLLDPEMKLKFYELLQAAGFALVWALFASWFAWKKKVFKPLSAKASSPIEAKNVFIGFTIFMLMQAIIAPFFLGLFYYLMTDQALTIAEMTIIPKIYLSLAVLVLTYGSLALYYYKFLTTDQKEVIFGPCQIWYKEYLFGACTWFFIYPFVLVISTLIDALILIFSQTVPVEQYVVEQFKLAISYPLLLIGMSLIISLLVPIGEEFLFRGLLQSWLKRKFHSPTIAIGLAAMLFSLFHYSTSQGVTNIQLLITLYLLGCFLGYLYEKHKTIWVSIGLHSMFNTVSAFLIFIGSE